MKHFLIQLSIFLAIQLLIAAAIYRNSLNQPRYGYMAAFEDKVQLLQEHCEPTLILVGGSNLAFGIDSEILENEIRLPTLNGGLHASLGLQFYLDVASKYARRGDTVILTAEFLQFSNLLYPDKKCAKTMMQQSPEGFAQLLTLEGFGFKELIDDFALPEIASQMQAGMKRYDDARVVKQRKKALKPGTYSRLNFNRHGDFVGHHGLPQAEVIPQLNSLYHFRPKNYAQSVAAINECAATLEARGVRMFFAYPPIISRLYERSRPDIDEIQEFLKANLDIPILHELQEVSYDQSCFFDTTDHLNESTKRERTKVLASAIQRQFTTLVSQEKPKKLR